MSSECQSPAELWEVPSLGSNCSFLHGSRFVCVVRHLLVLHGDSGVLMRLTRVGNLQETIDIAVAKRNRAGPIHTGASVLIGSNRSLQR